MTRLASLGLSRTVLRDHVFCAAEEVGEDHRIETCIEEEVQTHGIGFCFCPVVDRSGFTQEAIAQLLLLLKTTQPMVVSPLSSLLRLEQGLTVLFLRFGPLGQVG
jgi:hypothetical protein